MKILDWQTFNDVLNHNRDLDFQRNNPVFSQGTLACQEMKIGNAEGNGLRFWWFEMITMTIII